MLSADEDLPRAAKQKALEAIDAGHAEGLQEAEDSEEAESSSESDTV